MPSTSNVFLEVLDDDGEVQADLADSVDGALEFYVVPDTLVTALQAAEYLEVYDGSINVGGGVGNYPHVQAAASATWIITHNLGYPKEPTILLDSAPTVAVITDVDHSPGFNVTTLTFGSPVTGKAFF